jgi:hypothetical protein
MKIGYHFDADYPPFDGCYGLPIETKVFQTLLANRTLNISSKIFIGDLLLMNLSMDKEIKRNTETYTFSKNKFLSAVDKWLNPDNTVWRQFHPDKIQEVLDKNIFVVCFVKYSPIFGPLVKFIFVKSKPVKNESKKNQTQQFLQSPCCH